MKMVGIKFSGRLENTVGKGEIAHKEQFLLFPVFSKDLNCRHVKTGGLFKKGLKNMRATMALDRSPESFSPKLNSTSLFLWFQLVTLRVGPVLTP